jgi:hypothetical protein
VDGTAVGFSDPIVELAYGVEVDGTAVGSTDPIVVLE